MKILYCERCLWRQPDAVEDEQELPTRCPNCGQKRGTHFLTGTLQELIDKWPKIMSQFHRMSRVAIILNPIKHRDASGPTKRYGRETLHR